MKGMPIPPAFYADAEIMAWSRAVAGDQAVVDVSAAYTAKATDHTIRGDATSAAFTVTLPPAADVRGLLLVIKRLNGGTNNVTVSASGSELIDGLASKTLAAQYDVLRIQSSGSGWDVI